MKNYITHNLSISKESLKKLKVIAEYNNLTVEEEVLSLIENAAMITLANTRMSLTKYNKSN